MYFVDLDRFKQVNDTQGHAAGDVVLRRVAEQLVSILRPTDTVARLGGDEFVVLAPDLDNHMRALDLGARLIAELGRRLLSHEDGHRITASIGIAVSVGGRGSPELLLNEADIAMYQAKSLGGARAEVFDVALGLQMQERSTAQRVLQSALNEDRVVTFYQPIIDLGSGMVRGVEALVRIRDIDGSIVPPSSFIGAAEQSGLIVPLGSHVLNMACKEATRWPTPSGQLSIAVNLSARQFEPGDLPLVVEECLVATGLDPTCLHLELTETAIIDLRLDVLQQLGRIRDLGVEIGLDDFGTGYASLTHLRRLPLSFVKIDQSFVQGLGVDHEDERIVGAVVDLAANLGLRSIAEGVETVDQLARLRQLGSDQAQGYLFARPLPPADLAAVIFDAVW